MDNKRLWAYVATVVLVAAALAGIRSGWKEAIRIGCLPESGTPPAGTWMDGCGSSGIGDYGIDVLWFDLDQQAVASIRRAKVLLFGDSRILTAASLGGASSWFAERHIPMNLLAFGAGEQSGFTDRLVARLHPHPDLVVFDADPYFTGQESIPAQALAADPAGEEKWARQTQAFLDSGPVWCRYLGILCGRTARGYRRYLDGTVVHENEDRIWFNKNEYGSFPLTEPGPQDTSHYEEYLANARSMLAKLQVEPQCVVFTVVPNTEMDDTFARFLAERLGARVIAPRPPGLSTSDHYHLTADSAQIWAAAFFRELEPVVRQCTGRLAQGAAPQASTQ